MAYIDPKRLAGVDAEAFKNQPPYPWGCFEALVSEDGYRQLHADLPKVEQMKASFGRRRRYGQASHDRYVLEWSESLPLPESWRTFIAELQGPTYRDFIARMLGHDRFGLHFHWHYATRGCSVSPHCDARWKLGSHIFYFNTEDEWDPSWGGETLVLDDEGRFADRSAPKFEDFPVQHAATALGNNSMVFTRKGNSWHGVKPMTCPEGVLRKVFIVEIRSDQKFARAREFVRYLTESVTQ